MSLNPDIPGDSSIVAAGGVENMSQYPYVIRDARFGIPFGTVPPVSISRGNENPTNFMTVIDNICNL